MVSMANRALWAIYTKGHTHRTVWTSRYIKQLGLKAGEEVEWTLEVCKDGELIAAVRKTLSVKKPKK